MDRIELARVLANLANANDGLHNRDTMLSLGRSLDRLVAASGHENSDWFLRKLREILDMDCFRSIVSWLPQGKIWRIHNLTAFEMIVLPQMHFPHHFSNPMELFLAYTRVKGFQEISRGENSAAFYNEVRNAEVVLYRCLCIYITAVWTMPTHRFMLLSHFTDVFPSAS